MSDKEYEESLLKELKTTKKKVEYLLENYPETRNSDTYLCWLYAVKFMGVKRLDYEDFKKLMEVNFETITRMRRLIQAMGLHLPTDPVILARRRKELAMRTVIGEV